MTSLRKLLGCIAIILSLQGILNAQLPPASFPLPPGVYWDGDFDKAVAAAEASNKPLAFFEADYLVDTGDKDFLNLQKKLLKDLTEISVVAVYTSDQSPKNGTFHPESTQNLLSPVVLDRIVMSTVEDFVRTGKRDGRLMIPFTDASMSVYIASHPHESPLGTPAKKELQAAIRMASSAPPPNTDIFLPYNLLPRLQQLEGISGKFTRFLPPDSSLQIPARKGVSSDQVDSSPLVELKKPPNMDLPVHVIPLVHFSPGSQAYLRKVNFDKNRTPQQWVNGQGQTITAKFHHLENEDIYLEGGNGRIIHFPLSLLSPESQELAKSQAILFPLP